MTDYDSRFDSRKAPWLWFGTSNIKSLNIASGITHIGNYAFADLDNITNVIIPNTVTSIGNHAFENTGLLEIHFPNSVTEIGSLAFQNCENLKGVDFSLALETIENGAFRECDSLETIWIPASTTSVHYAVFSDCTNLRQIDVDSNNLHYSSANGVLYNKNQTLLIKCPGGYTGGEFIVPDSVTEIEMLAFAACQNISSVIIPNTVTQIQSGTFSECPNLTSIEIPVSVTSIAPAFYYTPISNVYYGGTQEDWEKISGLDASGNQTLLSANIHYNSSGSGMPESPEYSVTYNFNDEGATASIVQNYSVDKVVEIISELPAREGYTFSGWSDGTTTYQPGDTFTMPEHDVTLTAVWLADIDRNEVFIKQSVTGSNGGTCTLASATMMLRRYAIINGMEDWHSITETAVGKVAWGPGLSLGFDYIGVHVSAYPGVNVSAMTLEEKKAFFISMLEAHPEGIEIYRTDSAQKHAVLLTDYDAATGTFYCADPAPSAPSGRIPLSECIINEDTNNQDEKINVVNQIWYIQSSTSQKTLSSSRISAHCPVDMLVTINGQTLDSRVTESPISNDYATMTVTGTEADKEITVEIHGPYVLEYDVDVELVGNGIGTMTFVVEHTFSDGTTETHTFDNVPLSETTTGTASGFYPQSTILLFMEDSASGQGEIWAADPDESVTEPASDNKFDQLPNEDIIPSPDLPSEDNGNSSSSSSSERRYDIDLDVGRGGDVSLSADRASAGTRITITVDPDAGYELDELTVLDEDGDALTLTQRTNSTYTFHMPTGPVTVKASFIRSQAETAGLPFADVASNTWYYDAVEYMYENGLMSGVSDGWFSPDAALTRAQLVQILYALEGRPAVSNSSGFTDVTSADWFADAVGWAAANGVVSGVSAGTFAPNDPLTREQLALILYRYAQYKSYDTTQGGMAVREFSDYSTISSWALEAMDWAVNAGLLSGTGNGMLSPAGTATRAQVAQILMNFCETVAR